MISYFHPTLLPPSCDVILLARQKGQPMSLFSAGRDHERSQHFSDRFPRDVLLSSSSSATNLARHHINSCGVTRTMKLTLTFV
jgi:hypothetical protein